MGHNILDAVIGDGVVADGRDTGPQGLVFRADGYAIVRAVMDPVVFNQGFVGDRCDDTRSGIVDPAVVMNVIVDNLIGSAVDDDAMGAGVENLVSMEDAGEGA